MLIILALKDDKEAEDRETNAFYKLEHGVIDEQRAKALTPVISELHVNKKRLPYIYAKWISL